MQKAWEQLVRERGGRSSRFHLPPSDLYGDDGLLCVRLRDEGADDAVALELVRLV